MKLLGNLVWLLFGGLVGSLLWTVAGLVMCISVIGIPLGLQAFKIAGFVLWPFGRDVEVGEFGSLGLLGNLVWILLFGWELAVGHAVLGVLFCITVVGVPFGLQHFKIARLGLLPFGARIFAVD